MTRSGKPNPECEACIGLGYTMFHQLGSMPIMTRCPCTDTHPKIDTLTVQEETHPIGQRGVPEFHTVTRVDSAGKGR